MSTLLFIILALVAILAIYIIWATAILSKVNVKQLEFKETRIAYLTFIGDYGEAYKQTSIVEKAIKQKYGVDLTKEPCFGLYYDDPGQVERSKCRSVVGKFLPDSFKPENDEAPDGIFFGVIPRFENSLQILYPLRSVLSIFAGLMRAYPALEKYAKANHLDGQESHAILEVYGYEGANILYCAGLGKSEGLWDDFPKQKNE